VTSGYVVEDDDVLSVTEEVCKLLMVELATVILRTCLVKSRGLREVEWDCSKEAGWLPGRRHCLLRRSPLEYDEFSILHMKEVQWL
jgi:hypothetical protein